VQLSRSGRLPEQTEHEKSCSADASAAANAGCRSLRSMRTWARFSEARSAFTNDIWLIADTQAVTARSPWPECGSRSPRRGPRPAPLPFPFGLLQPPRGTGDPRQDSPLPSAASIRSLIVTRPSCQQRIRKLDALARSYVIQGMRMLAVTWANDTRGKSVFWLHTAVRRGIWPSVDDQLGITPRASSDSSGYIFATQHRVSAAHVPFSSDTPT